MTQAEIKQWIIDNIFSPLRNKGKVEVKLRAGDLHRVLRLTKRMPTICGALDNVAGECSFVTLIREEIGQGITNRTRKGANVWYIYKID